MIGILKTINLGFISLALTFPEAPFIISIGVFDYLDFISVLFTSKGSIFVKFTTFVDFFISVLIL